jgi:hypothetical protein
MNERTNPHTEFKIMHPLTKRKFDNARIEGSSYRFQIKFKIIFILGWIVGFIVG